LQGQEKRLQMGVQNVEHVHRKLDDAIDVFVPSTFTRIVANNIMTRVLYAMK